MPLFAEIQTWLLLAHFFLYWNRLRRGKIPSLPVMMMMTWTTWTENSLNFVSAWVARYGSFTWTVHLLFQMNKTNMLIIQRNVQKLYLCCSILERQISYSCIFQYSVQSIFVQSPLETPGSEQGAYFPSQASQLDVFSDPKYYQYTWGKNARWQCQGTAAEQSCEPCPWSWMIFFTKMIGK